MRVVISDPCPASLWVAGKLPAASAEFSTWPGAFGQSSVSFQVSVLAGDPVPVSYWLARNLPLPAAARQTLLEAPCAAARLRAILRLLGGARLRCAGCRTEVGSFLCAKYLSPIRGLRACTGLTVLPMDSAACACWVARACAAHAAAQRWVLLVVVSVFL